VAECWLVTGFAHEGAARTVPLAPPPSFPPLVVRPPSYTHTRSSRRARAESSLPPASSPAGAVPCPCVLHLFRSSPPSVILLESDCHAARTHTRHGRAGAFPDDVSSVLSSPWTRPVVSTRALPQLCQLNEAKRRGTPNFASGED